MDISETRVLLRGAVKIFKAGLQSKTWDIHEMPHFITTTHHEGCDTCEAYALHIVEALKVLTVEILPRDVKKAFCTAWLNIVCHIEDEASSESDKKVEWYSDCYDNLMDDLRLAEEKASAEWDHCWKADEKLAQANSKIAEPEAKLASFQKELIVLQKQDKRMPIAQGDHTIFLIQNQKQLLARKGRREKHSIPPSNMGDSSLMRPVCWYQLMNRCQWFQYHHKQWGHRPHHCGSTHPCQGLLLCGGRVIPNPGNRNVTQAAQKGMSRQQHIATHVFYW